MSVERPRWGWEGNKAAQMAFLEDCLAVLEGQSNVNITRAHLAACADWALREHHKNTLLTRRYARLKQAVARAHRLAVKGVVRKTARTRVKGE